MKRRSWLGCAVGRQVLLHSVFVAQAGSLRATSQEFDIQLVEFPFASGRGLDFGHVMREGNSVRSSMFIDRSIRRMRILQICSARQIGGGERHLADLANGLTRRGHDVFAALNP